MEIATGTSLGQEICNALGIDPSWVCELTLKCKVGEVAKLDVITIVPSSTEIKTELQSYEVRKKNGNSEN